MEQIAADDAVLFLWAFNPALPEAFQVIDAWGFSYRTNMVWVKNRIGTGKYVRGRHELLLIAKRGNVPVPCDSDRPESVIFAPRTKHSRKPDVAYNRIEKMYPDCLACLFVIGLATDAPAVEPLLSHPDGAIRKAARTCLFEIRRRIANDRE